MTRRDLLEFCFKRKNTILGWWLFITLLTGVLVYVYPQGYLAQSAVLVERTKSPMLTPGNFTAPDMAEAMNTEAQIVRSRPVAEVVVDQLGLDAPAAQDAPPESAWEAFGSAISRSLVAFGLQDQVSAREAWIETLMLQVSVEPIVDSNVLTVRYSSPDPELAAGIVNAVTDAYIAQRRSLYSTRGASGYFRGRMEKAGEELEKLREALADFKTRYAVSALADSKAQLVREISGIRDRITTLRAQRADLKSRFAASHPRVVVATNNIAAAERGKDARVTELRELESKQSTIDDLKVLIASQEQVFLDLKARFEQERAREAAPDNLVNTQVIEYAAVPARPRFSRLFFLKLALVGGLLLAFFIALLREYFDHRVTSPEVAERALGVPVLASIGKHRAIQKY